MQHFLKRLLQLVLVVAVSVPLWAGDGSPSGKASTAKNESLTGAAMSTESDAALSPALLGILVMKGVLTSDEANNLRSAPSASGASQLLNLLKEKGVVTDADLVQANLAPTASLNLVTSTTSAPQGGQAAPKPPEPAVIPAVAPLRVLPIDIPKQGGLIPDIKLGSGASMKVYGFFKASAVSDTTSSGGATFGSQDWPLPLLLSDTGPTKDPQVHIKARSFRIGTQAEWVPKDSNITLTGRIEGDFEGDYTNVNNRNISSARSSQFSLRVAWARLDTKLGGTLPWFAQFGQDWTLVSTTLPSLFETTGVGLFMGSLYERAPMFKTGVQFHSGDFKVQPEFAIVMPIAGSSTLTTDQRLRFGDRAGAESNQPGLEARVVFQFPLSHNWKGVAPAQIIFSGHHARMNEIIPAAKQVIATDQTCTVLPCTITPFPVFTSSTAPNLGFSTTTSILGASNCAEPGGTCNLLQLFAKGAQVGNAQNIWTAELQLPTPWVTFDAKFYRGEDMRFFFAGQLDDVFSNLLGMKEVGTGVSFSGRAITFGCAGGVSGVSATGTPTVTCPGSAVLPARLQPVGGSGGFAELSFPLSRIFHANPEGHNSGWVLHTTYSTDRANYADAQAGTQRLGRTDLDTASLTYRLNKWVTFVHEASYIVTRTANIHEASGAILPEYLPFAGGKTRQAHNWRNEFGPVFTF